MGIRQMAESYFNYDNITGSPIMENAIIVPKNRGNGIVPVPILFCRFDIDVMG